MRRDLGRAPSLDALRPYTAVATLAGLCSPGSVNFVTAVLGVVALCATACEEAPAAPAVQSVADLHPVAYTVAGPPIVPAVRLSEPPVANGPFRPGEHWVGTYVCPQGVTKLDLQIVSASAVAVTDAIFKFDYVPPPQPGVAPGTRTGAFHLSGAIHPDDLQVELDPGAWIVRPDAGWRTVGMRGSVDVDTMTFAGNISATECGGFSVQRGERPIDPDPVRPPMGGPTTSATSTPAPPTAPAAPAVVRKAPSAPVRAPASSGGGGGMALCCDGLPSPLCLCPGHRG
jgi:hypothetical protein